MQVRARSTKQRKKSMHSMVPEEEATSEEVPSKPLCETLLDVQFQNEEKVQGPETGIMLMFDDAKNL